MPIFDQVLANEGAELLRGLGRTIAISTIGICFGGLIGAFFGALRYAGIPLLSRAIGGYVHLFRCTPLLVQIVLIFYALPDIGIRLSAFESSWIALAIWGGAYQTEVFRSAFSAVPKAEILAARALGMPAFRTFLDITLPIGLRYAIPSATTTAITQFRSSSFMVVIGYTELTYVANRIVSESFKVFEVFGIASLVYLAGSFLMSFASRRLENAVHIPGIGVVK